MAASVEARLLAVQALVESLVDDELARQRREQVTGQDDSLVPVLVTGVPDEMVGQLGGLTTYSPNLSELARQRRIVIGVTESGRLVPIKNNVGDGLGATVVEYHEDR